MDSKADVPKQFEFIDNLQIFRFENEERRFGIPTFVTVLDSFIHHYTGTKMYYVRMEYESDKKPAVKYETLTEDILISMLKKQR